MTEWHWTLSHISPGSHHKVSVIWHFLTFKLSLTRLLLCASCCVFFRWLWWGEDWRRPERGLWWKRGNSLQLRLLPFCVLPGIPLCHDDRHQLVPVSDSLIVVQCLGMYGYAYVHVSSYCGWADWGSSLYRGRDRNVLATFLGLSTQNILWLQLALDRAR